MHATETRSTCPYCGVGCGVIVESDGTRIVGVRGDPAHPANAGRLCTKGATLHLTASDDVRRQARLLHPELREHRAQPRRRVGWSQALSYAADRIAGVVERYGPDAVGFYVSGQLLTEDYYVFNKLAKGLIGTNNIDSNSRLCMSSAVAGYKATLGADAPPSCYEDIAHAHCLFIAGSNAAWAHPILFRRIEDARRAKPSMRIVVVDPRRTETAEAADLHLPLRPGTDVPLMHAMLNVMLREGWVRRDYVAAHTAGFGELEALVCEATPQHAAQLCGVPADDIATAARWFAMSPATLSLYCQGLNQSVNGTAKNAALVGLHLATAQIGRPGAGPFSLTGQPNAMGGREVGAMANLLPGHRDLADPADRAAVAAFWGVDAISDRTGRSAVEMFEAAADGEIRALWIACTNPAQSMPDQATVRRALERAEFVVVQEAFAGAATCAYADLLLPAASWGEKEGTVTNSERRISRVRAAVAPPGEALPDWRIAVELARRLESRLRPGRQALFPYEQPEAIWNEHRESTRGRDLDVTGLSWARLDAQGPQQWPFPEGASEGRGRLYEDGRFPTVDGRARFAALAWRPPADPVDARHPFTLITGRLRDQWHGMTRTGTLGRLFGHVPEPTVGLHPQDMARLGLAPGDLVHVTSRRGSVVVPAHSLAGLGQGQAWMAMHWGPEVLGGRGNNGAPMQGVNALTPSAACPISRQPELKGAAVRILKAHFAWSMLAIAWLPGDRALRTRAELAGMMAAFGFAACVPFGRERSGVLLRAAADAPPPKALLARIETLLGLDRPDVLRYVDRRLHRHRAVLLRGAEADSPLDAVMLAGDTRSEAWLKPLLQAEAPARVFGRALLQPDAKPPVPVAPRDPQVCTCFDVGQAVIVDALAGCAGADDAARLAALQARLLCGTNCGSCIPELLRLVRATPARAAVGGGHVHA